MAIRKKPGRMSAEGALSPASLDGVKRTIGARLKRLAASSGISYCGKLWSPVEFYSDDPDHYAGCDIVLTMDESFLLEMGAGGQLYDRAVAMAAELGLSMEHWSHDQIHFMFEDERAHQYSQDVSRFDWLKLILTPSFDLSYQNLFAFFAKRPQEMHHLAWREFEILLAATLRNVGFHVELGPGSNDGGVDMLLVSHDFVSELRTVVQAKKYAPSHPIDLTAVQALTAVMDDRKANRALFATTSRFLPSVKAFAENQHGKIQLVDGSDLHSWMNAINARIERSAVDVRVRTALAERSNRKSTSISPVDGTRLGDVLVSPNYSGHLNSFCLILEACPGAALAIELPAHAVDAHGEPLFVFGTRGLEMPILDPQHTKFVDRVFRSEPFIVRQTQGHLSGKRLAWDTWNEAPVHYDWND